MTPYYGYYSLYWVNYYYSHTYNSQKHCENVARNVTETGTEKANHNSCGLHQNLATFPGRCMAGYSADYLMGFQRDL